ncbi:MAG: DUF192 domain-containing protein [Alphaproteobacteria bacterium]|nr:DUF192 domain-containing protein [Alphaproteobacteria bacterium]
MRSNLKTKREARLSRRWFVAAGAASGAVLLFGAGSGPAAAQAQLDFERDTLKIVKRAGGRVVFDIEIARTGEQRAQGLMFRPSLPADAGMLFDYRRVQPVTMWMKNTMIPLDILFIDEDGIITHIVERAVPYSLKPLPSRGPVRAVLELNGGTVAKQGFRVGDRVRHALFGTGS